MNNNGSSRLTLSETAECPAGAEVLVLAGSLTLSEATCRTALAQTDRLLVGVVVLVHGAGDAGVDKQLTCGPNKTEQVSQIENNEIMIYPP